jgi:transposase InsO family protein
MSNRAALKQEELAYLTGRKQAGATHAQVTKELGCARETVRKHWQTIRRGQTKRPPGRPATGILSTFPEEVRQQAIQLKQSHPHWGPNRVLAELPAKHTDPAQPLPHRSQLAALFKNACPEAVQPYRRAVPPEPAEPRATQVHQRWQVDAKERIPLGDGQVATQLDIIDPASGVWITSQAFTVSDTLEHWRKLTLVEIQNAVREGLAQFGCPAEIQTDHEGVYAGAKQSDFPTLWQLWLRGLGIRPIFSRSGQPTDQAEVERLHRTIAELTWRNQPPQNLADLQQQLATGRDHDNHLLPSQAADCQGRPPLIAYPQAEHSDRAYDPGGEWDLFQLALVDDYLAGVTWSRRADKVGVVFLGNHPYRLGRTQAHLTVQIRFLPENREFRFETQAGKTLTTHPALGLGQAEITGLTPSPWQSRIPVQLSLPLVGV